MAMLWSLAAAVGLRQVIIDTDLSIDVDGES